VIQDLGHEVALLCHRSSLDASKLLDGAPKNPGAMELVGCQAVRADVWSCLSEGFNIRIEPRPCLRQERAWDYWASRYHLKQPRTPAVLRPQEDREDESQAMRRRERPSHRPSDDTLQCNSQAVCTCLGPPSASQPHGPREV